MFLDFLNETSAVTYCDGEGIRLGAMMLGVKLPPRIVLTYYLWDLLVECEQEGRTIMLLGSRPEIAELAARNIGNRYPRLKIVGVIHGYFDRTGPENDRILSLISEAAPDVLFVGMGMPLQELWIAANHSRIRAGVILPCGSMIEYAAKRKSLAPAWMANHGMEWLYRLFQEPRRLWRRYLLGNPEFLLRVALQRLREGKAQ
jgi:N-acetylglucosaminyldiphosphoundecaprenol N-acetyl-beta-D-mannosaminyltransferase